ncbi:MAG: hypothetical protein BWK77_02665 [Verrucomicrobia bacterium A1]|nr:MAG: hypothetical protein BWK77_02665 [Verrucomicrobia bacterium A1]
MTEESSTENVFARIVQTGYPGGRATPRWSAATTSCPEYSRVTVGARVAVYTPKATRNTTAATLQSSLVYITACAPFTGAV